jgi:hypothetical protein
LPVTSLSVYGRFKDSAHEETRAQKENNIATPLCMYEFKEPFKKLFPHLQNAFLIIFFCVSLSFARTRFVLCAQISAKGEKIP